LWDRLVLVPVVLVILFFAVYPQLALRRSENSVKAAVAPAHLALGGQPTFTEAMARLDASPAVGTGEGEQQSASEDAGSASEDRGGAAR
jgi:hypothetical protein